MQHKNNRYKKMKSYFIINTNKVKMEIIKNGIPEEHETKETMWTYKDKKQLFNKYSQIETQVIQNIDTPIIQIEQLSKTSGKTKKNTPLELIIQYTSCSHIMKREIKDKLIEFISIPEFSRAFGVKKSAEIISAITRDSWNQSTALFISFLLDSNVVYKDKSYIYNKDKVNKEIIVMN